MSVGDTLKLLGFLLFYFGEIVALIIGIKVMFNSDFAVECKPYQPHQVYVQFYVFL